MELVCASFYDIVSICGESEEVDLRGGPLWVSACQVWDCLNPGLAGYFMFMFPFEADLGGVDSGTGCRDELEVERELLNDTVGVYSG